MNNPLVSILIPVYKRGKLACEAIDSALSQSYSNIEIIISDNNSDDGTFELLSRKYSQIPNVILLKNKINLGAVKNWEQCLENAKGKYIKFLWSDDLMDSSFVSDAVKMFNLSENISFVYSSVIIFQDNWSGDDILNGKTCYSIGETGIYCGEEFIKKHYLESPGVVPVSPGCAMFRRSKLKILDDIPNNIGYEHNINGAGPDLLMFLEAVANGENFGFINKPLNFFRAHPGSISCSDVGISKGYLTAKLYFTIEHDYVKYIPNLVKEILSERKGFSVLDKAGNKRVLDSYFGSIEYNEHDYCLIFEILVLKIIRRINKILR